MMCESGVWNGSFHGNETARQEGGGVTLSVSTKVIETVRPSRELKGGTASPESSRDYKT